MTSEIVYTKCQLIIKMQKTNFNKPELKSYKVCSLNNEIKLELKRKIGKSQMLGN